VAFTLELTFLKKIMVSTCNGTKSSNSHIDKVNLFLPLVLALAYYKLGITNPTPLKNNLVPEICKKRDVEGLICSLFFIIASKTESLVLFLVISG
jgi:superfamily II DNA/RNA helicase